MEDSERICRLICKHAADLISVVSASGQRVYLNPSYQKIFGITSSDSSAFPEIHPDDRPIVKKVIDDTLATGVSQRAEVRLDLVARHPEHLCASAADTVVSAAGRVEPGIIPPRDQCRFVAPGPPAD